MFSLTPFDHRDVVLPAFNGDRRCREVVVPYTIRDGWGLPGIILNGVLIKKQRQEARIAKCPGFVKSFEAVDTNGATDHRTGPTMPRPRGDLLAGPAG